MSKWDPARLTLLLQSQDPDWVYINRTIAIQRLSFSQYYFFRLVKHNESFFWSTQKPPLLIPASPPRAIPGPPPATRTATPRATPAPPLAILASPPATRAAPPPASLPFPDSLPAIPRTPSRRFPNPASVRRAPVAGDLCAGVYPALSSLLSPASGRHGQATTTPILLFPASVHSPIST
jgi:hypothetical protein